MIHPGEPPETIQETVTDPVEVGVREAAMSIKEWLWIGITAAGLLLIYFSPLSEHLTHLQDINDNIAEFGRWGPVLFVVISTILITFGLPRMIINPIAGIAFGLTWGLLWSLIASLAGAYFTFCYARWAGRDLILRKWPKLEKVTQYFENSGILTVALFRQLPNPGVLTNLFFGISPIKHSSYLVGTAIGYLPSAIPATLIGTSAIQDSSQGRIWHLIAAIGSIIALWLVFGLYLRSSPRFKALKKNIRGSRNAN